VVDRIVRLPEVIATVGLRRSAIYARVRDGRFPPPLKITNHAVGWRESDLARWIAQRPCPRSKPDVILPTIRVRHRRPVGPPGCIP
jgi:prophage regulatory protein